MCKDDIELETYEGALMIAVACHAGCKDKGGKPYIRHPINVAEQLEDELDQVVALLHDTVEDTEMTLDQLRLIGFSEEIIEAIDCITRRVDDDGNKEELDTYLGRVLQSPRATRVKFADINHNNSRERLMQLSAEEAQRLNKKYEHCLDVLLNSRGVVIGTKERDTDNE